MFQCCSRIFYYQVPGSTSKHQKYFKVTMINNILSQNNREKQWYCGWLWSACGVMKKSTEQISCCDGDVKFLLNPDYWHHWLLFEQLGWRWKMDEIVASFATYHIVSLVNTTLAWVNAASLWVHFSFNFSIKDNLNVVGFSFIQKLSLHQQHLFRIFEKKCFPLGGTFLVHLKYRVIKSLRCMYVT